MSHAFEQMRWVRPPRQSRSQESLERILDAAEEIITEKGFEQATVAEIARRANSSVGAFYGRFREKEDLFRCLLDRFCEEALATAAEVLRPERWSGHSVRQILAETVPFLVAVCCQKRGLMRAFIVQGTKDPEFARRFVPLRISMADHLRAVLLAEEHQHEVRHPDPEFAILLGLKMLLCTLDMMTLYESVAWGDMAPGQEKFSNELSRVVYSYLACE